jgi:hypothetical protein
VADQSAPACDRCARTGREYYKYFSGLYEFDVESARKWVADGREPVEVDPDSVRESVEITTVDETHVDHVNPAYPGIITHVWFCDDDGAEHHGHLLIDGNHRAARCLRDGRPFFAYVLTEDESRAVVLRGPADFEKR